MIEKLRSAAVQEFIRANENADTADILLKFRDVEGVPAGIIANQIAGRRKASDKIPLYYNTKEILYPPVRNLEQSSSEQTALFKAMMLKNLSITGPCLDLSGGFGIDSYFLSTVCKEVTMVEPDNSLLAVAAHNYTLLGASNIRHINSNAESFLASTTEKFDLIYIDPSRRTAGNKKVYTLRDSEPDILQLREQVLQRSAYLLIKASPLLDIQQALSGLLCVEKVVVLSLDNECKELLFLLTDEKNLDPEIDAINIRRSVTSKFKFTFSEEKAATPSLSTPKAFLYEPNASILKAGAFKTIADRYDLVKLHPNTHLYSSDIVFPDFPGKIFNIIAYVKPDSKDLRQYFPEGKANVAVRNYPLDPPALKKKTGLKDGGDMFLIGFTGIDKKYLVVARRVN